LRFEPGHNVEDELADFQRQLVLQLLQLAGFLRRATVLRDKALKLVGELHKQYEAN